MQIGLGAGGGYGSESTKQTSQSNTAEDPQLFTRRIEFLDAALQGAETLKGDLPFYTSVMNQLKDVVAQSLTESRSEQTKQIYQNAMDYIQKVSSGQSAIPPEQMSRLTEAANLQLAAGTKAIDESFTNSVEDAHKSLIARGIRGGVMTNSGPATSLLSRAAASRVTAQGQLQSGVRGTLLQTLADLEKSMPANAATIWSLADAVKNPNLATQNSLVSILSQLAGSPKTLVSLAGALPGQSNSQTDAAAYGSDSGWNIAGKVAGLSK